MICGGRDECSSEGRRSTSQFMAGRQRPGKQLPRASVQTVQSRGKGCRSFRPRSDMSGFCIVVHHLVFVHVCRVCPSINSLCVGVFKKAPHICQFTRPRAVVLSLAVIKFNSEVNYGVHLCRDMIQRRVWRVSGRTTSLSCVAFKAAKGDLPRGQNLNEPSR